MELSSQPWTANCKLASFTMSIILIRCRIFILASSKFFWGDLENGFSQIVS